MNVSWATASFRVRGRLIPAVGFFVLLSAYVGTVQATDRIGDCRVGIYQLHNGDKIDIGPTDGAHLRWRREDGTTGVLTPAANGTWTSTLGWTDRPDGNSATFDCKAGHIDFNGIEGRRVPLEVTNTTFEGAGVRLAGRLVMPEGNARVPIVVLVHGSDIFPRWISIPRSGNSPLRESAYSSTTSVAPARRVAATRRITCCWRMTPLRR